MTDPLSITASVIAVASLAWQSIKTASEIIDGIAVAPEAIANARNVISQTQNTLDSLREVLTSGNESAGAIEPVLQKINLKIALDSTRRLCDDFGKTIEGVTSHSTDSKFSRRDRVAASFRESKITKFNRQLGDCQRTISMALVSINLIVSSRTLEDIQQLSGRFAAQETALAELSKQLRESQTVLQEMSPGGSDGEESDAERDAQVTVALQQACDDAFSATRTWRTRQSFGGMSTDDNSTAMQGIVGTPHAGVEQKFGKLNTTNHSRAFQGQMDSDSFRAMLGQR